MVRILGNGDVVADDDPRVAAEANRTKAKARLKLVAGGAVLLGVILYKGGHLDGDALASVMAGPAAWGRRTSAGDRAPVS